MTNPPGFGGNISACIPFESRDSFSLDFILCEQGNGWPAVHFSNAFFAALFYPDFFVASFVVFFAEMLEWASFILVGKPLLGIEFPGKFDFETMAGSWVGDVLIQGFSGLVAGFLYRYLWEGRTALGPLERFRTLGMVPESIPRYPLVVKVFGTFSFVVFHFLGALAFFVGDRINIGIVMVLISTLAFAIGFWFATNSSAWRLYFWGRWSRSRSASFVLVAWFIVAIVMVHNLGFLYILDNQWFQTWIWQGGFLVLLGFLALATWGSRLQ